MKTPNHWLVERHDRKAGSCLLSAKSQRFFEEAGQFSRSWRSTSQ